MRVQTSSDRYALRRHTRGPSCAAAISSMLLMGCTIEPCPEFTSPCPEAFEVHEWCGSDHCELDGQPADCNAGGCLVQRDEVLFIPVDQLLSSAEGRDLRLEGFNGGCNDGNAAADVIATIDGVAGTPVDGSERLLRWDPFPSAPTRLELSYAATDAASCIQLKITFVDAECEAQHPGPANCVE